MPIRHYSHQKKTPVTLLACAVALALQINVTAAAQQAADPATTAQQTGVTELEHVEVKGSYRASLQQSLDEKRYRVEQVDAIFAEDIGKFPDQNLAESLQRIAGVSIDREGG